MTRDEVALVKEIARAIAKEEIALAFKENKPSAKEKPKEEIKLPKVETMEVKSVTAKKK